MQLSNKEEKLIGKWIYENGSIHKDKVSDQIECLINNQLKRIGTDKSGWDVNVAQSFFVLNSVTSTNRFPSKVHLP